jgi:hypothetical protein
MMLVGEYMAKGVFFKHAGGSNQLMEGHNDEVVGNNKHSLGYAIGKHDDGRYNAQVEEASQANVEVRWGKLGG